jgi:subfamily B ATP-binding cassette protein HlyB/CyaB
VPAAFPFYIGISAGATPVFRRRLDEKLLSSRVRSPVLRLAQIWQDFHQARLSVERLGDILNTPAEPTHNPTRSALPPIRGDINFEHVSFRYRVDGPEVLHDISLTIPAGQVVGIVGPSGSGKSTLAKLIHRLYVPENGRVLVDGVDLAMVDTAWLRRQVGDVLQEDVLFNRTVRDNIALADPAMPMPKIIAATMLAGAHDSFLSSRRVTTQSSASAAALSRAASGSASQSPVRLLPIRAF